MIRLVLLHAFMLKGVQKAHSVYIIVYVLH